MGPSAGEAVGAVLNGRYRLVRLIGEGGLAAVYEAQPVHAPHERRAIKLLHPQYVGNPTVTARFRAEASACLSLRHRRIATVEAYDEAEDGSPYLVMELLVGADLHDHLRRHAPLPLATAAPIALGVLEALQVAHAQGIVHRDLKPANLFLIEESGQLAVKVLDFGIAKVMDVAGGMGTKTRTGAVLGTPGYMSPEQVRDAKAVDPRSDLWSAGVVFYEMLTGEHPFGRAENLARMVAVLRDPATPIQHHASHYASWQPFFDRALARDPAQRYQSAEQMADELRRYAGDAIPDPADAPTQGMAASIDMRPTASKTAMSEAVPAASIQPSVGLPLTHAVSRTHSGTETMRAVPDPRGIPATDHRSVPPPHYGAYPSAPPPAPMAGSPAAKPTGTQVSRAVPEGTPTIVSDLPPVNIVEAADEEPWSLVWWGVILVAVGCFALGLMLGYVLAS